MQQLTTRWSILDVRFGIDKPDVTSYSPDMKPIESECHFFIIHDSNGSRSIHLTSLTYSLGRSSKSAIVLPSSSISREHALLLRMPCPNPGRYMFRLLDGNANGKPSLNGFTVNGEKKSVHDLQDGDLIVFGGAIEVSYAVTAEGVMSVEDSKRTLANEGLQEDAFTVLGSHTKRELEALISN